jgi:uncharacterized protein
VAQRIGGKAVAKRNAQSVSAWPFEAHGENNDVVQRAIRRLGHDARHGRVGVRRALDVTGNSVATLSLDVSLAGFNPASALFLDTETTGLSGGTGTLAFLIGMGWFEGDCFCVEQMLLCDPGDEHPMLSRVAARIAAASALVTFNGRTFDLPLLRSRFVMARVAPPAEPPHLDLLHVARRIYGSRVERCTLVGLERDVLGFERIGDVNGADIPSLYQRFLREGHRDSVVPVVEHNVWDLVALAALTGELGARWMRTEAEGYFEASDLVGMARTTQRAGDADLAILLATEAAALSTARGELHTAKKAHVLAAEIHKRANNPEATCERLLDALLHSPDDADIHLALARCYERSLKDFTRALHHAQLAKGAEDETVRLGRVTRLKRKAAGAVQLKLPWI